ncbi:MAG: hypothetical protein ACRDJC_09355 [Thermomicrobiales bacterium]
MSPDRGTADRLNDHLDAVVSGDVARSHDLDPSIAATVERFFTADDAPGPPPGLADRIWAEVMDHTATVELVLTIPASRPDRNGRAPLRFRRTAPPNHGPSALAYLATAALVLLTLVGSFVALRGSLPLIGPEERAVIIPAIDDATELPAGVIEDVVLLRATLEEMPPAGGTPRIGLYRTQLAPGAVERGGSQADTGVGNELFTIESGQVTVEADAPVVVTRAATNPAAEPILTQPGTAIVLDVGDQLLAPNGVSFRLRNDDLNPATVLGFSIGTVGDNVQAVSRPPGVTYSDGFPYKLPGTYPTVPAEATVHRLTLAPGAELPVRDLPGLELVYVEAGALDFLDVQTEMPATAVRAFTIRAGSGAETFGPTPARTVLANRGTEPLVILTASVVPTGASELTPQASGSDGWGTGDHLPGEPRPD